VLLCTVLVLAVTMAIYLHFYQGRLLGNLTENVPENSSWDHQQLEHHALKLQLELQQAVSQPTTSDTGRLQQRMDAFEDQYSLLEQRPLHAMHAPLPESRAVLEQVQAFLLLFSDYFTDGGAARLDASVMQRMLSEMRHLEAPLHELVQLSHRATQADASLTTNEVRQVIHIDTALLLFQGLLVLLFAFIVLRQMRQLDQQTTALRKALAQTDRSYAELSSYMQAIDQHALVTVASL